MLQTFTWAKSYHHHHKESRSSRHRKTVVKVTIDSNQQLVDFYEVAKLKWVSVYSHVQRTVSSQKGDNGGLSRSELGGFEITFHSRHREMVLNSYIPFILEQGRSIEEENKTVMLHMMDNNCTSYWSSTKFEHPASYF